MFLVMDESKASRDLKYEERFKIFNDPEVAMAFAKTRGWTDPFGMGLNLSEGMCNSYWGGLVKVSILVLPVTEEI